MLAPAKPPGRDGGPCRDIVLLGSTGSIGTQAADIIRRNPGRFRVAGLAAGGGNAALLASQALEFGAEVVAVARDSAARDLQLAVTSQAATLGLRAGQLPKILAGPDAVAEVAAWPCDIVLNAVTGAVGLAATLAALDAGRLLALANKESLIMGGPLVTSRAAPGQIVPVDSEHSAIAQCLRSGRADEVRRLVVTASGGPFLHRGRAELSDVTPEQALAHPTWSMGPVITVNSATLVNKGLELIEANLLFGIGFDRIDVVVHRQSVVHSMVEFTDGSTITGLAGPGRRRRPGDRLDRAARLDVRAAGRRCLPRGRACPAGRDGRRRRSGRVQRGERGMRRGFPGRAHPVPADRRYGVAGSL